MKNYLHFVGFGLGLIAVIFLSSFNALFMTPRTEWFENLSKPHIVPVLHSLCWLVSYLLTAVTIGEFIVNKDIFRYIFLMAIFIGLNILWCFLFFRANELISSLIIFIAILCVQGFILYITTKRTKFTCFCALINLIWYVYMFVIFIAVIVMNR